MWLASRSATVNSPSPWGRGTHLCAESTPASAQLRACKFYCRGGIWTGNLLLKPLYYFVQGVFLGKCTLVTKSSDLKTISQKTSDKQAYCCDTPIFAPTTTINPQPCYSTRNIPTSRRICRLCRVMFCLNTIHSIQWRQNCTASTQPKEVFIIIVTIQ